MNIGIDIDDTISNTYEMSLAYAFKFNKDDLKRESNIDSLKCDNHYFKTIFNWSDQDDYDFWKKYFRNITDEVHVKPFAKEVINKLKEEGNKIILISARNFDDDFEPKLYTQKWLDKNGIKYDELIISEEKRSVIEEKNIDVFIDDSISNMRRLKDLNIKLLLMDSRMNLYEEMNDDVKRVYSWTQIYEELKRGQ